MSYASAVERMPPLAILDLRGDPAAIRALLAREALAVPEVANSRAERDGVAVAWVGPRHWLAMAPSEREEPMAERLAHADVATVVVSDAWMRFRVSGPERSEILAQACPLDTDPRAFPTNGATFTEIFGQKGLLTRRGDAFDCFVDSSFASYVADWFARCGARMA